MRRSYVLWRMLYHAKGHCACRSKDSCARWLHYWERRLVRAA